MTRADFTPGTKFICTVLYPSPPVEIRGVENDHIFLTEIGTYRTCNATFPDNDHLVIYTTVMSGFPTMQTEKIPLSNFKKVEPC